MSFFFFFRDERGIILFYFSKVNVGTSGAEIGAAFGGNKVSSFCDTSSTLVTCNASFIRAQGGAVNLAVTLGSNMYAGARARSTFPTRHPSHKVSTSPHHDNEQAWRLAGFLRKKANHPRAGTTGGRKMLHFHFCCVLPWGETLWGHTVYKKEREKVIINHIYDAVREPT